MEFEKLISPMKTDEFVEKHKNNETFLIKGENNKFSNLITLEEIERTLNNGCNISTPVEIIIDGGRKYFVQKDIQWTQFAVHKSSIKKMLEDKHSFLMRNQTQINKQVSNLIDTIEQTFENSTADMHLYISPITSSTGYDAHRDRPQHKIYMQVIGKTNWVIFDYKENLSDKTGAIKEKEEDIYLKKRMEFMLEPGDLLYMPPDTFHKVRNEDGPRVSFSIPFVIHKENIQRMDRTHIPFKEIFESFN